MPEHGFTGISAKNTDTFKKTTAVDTISSSQSGPRGRTSRAAAGAGEISANATIIKKKLGPAAPDNILHNYSSYTYKISLLAWNDYKDYNKVVEKGTWEKMPGMVSKYNKVLFSSGGVPKARRHPAFNVDFYIVDLSTTSMMGMSSNTRSTNIFEATMTVVEPLGTTLLERLEAVLTTDGPNWTEKPLLIQIDFTGYDEAGKASLIKPATRWIPVRLINMTFDIQASGSTYGLEFIATSMMSKNPLTNALHCKSLTGSNIQEFADQIVEAFKKEQVARSTTVIDHTGANNLPPRLRHTKKVITAKVQEIPDEIEFDIHPDIAKATVSPNVAAQTNLKKGASIELATEMDSFSSVDWTEKKKKATDNTKPKTVYEHNTGVRYEPLEAGGYLVEVCDKGQSYLSFFEKLIRQSTFITDQLEDPTKILETHGTKSIKKNKLLKNSKAGLRWFKTTWSKTLLEYDSMRNEYASKMIVQITPYMTIDPVATTATCLPGEGDIPPVARNYQYQYTGQNLDIKDLQITFNNAFFMAVMGLGTDNAGSSKESVNAAEEVVVGGGDDQDYNKLGAAATRAGMINSFDPGIHTTKQQRAAGTLMENLYKRVGADMMHVTMTLVGDPAYIQQDGILHMTTKNKSCFQYPKLAVDPLSGAVLCDQADCHMYLVYRTPEDINEATGITDFSVGDKRFRSSTLSGYYRVWEVTNTFSGGTFTQQIEATRLYNQTRESKNKPTLEDELDVLLANSTKPAKSSGGVYKAGQGQSGQSKTLSEQKQTIKADQKQESTAITAVDDTSTLTNNDAMQANEFADGNVITKQNTGREAIAFRTAEANRAGINAISTTSTDATTLAGKIGPGIQGFSPRLYASISDSVPSTLTPVFTEMQAVAASTRVRRLASQTAYMAGENHGSHLPSRSTSAVLNNSIVITDSTGNVLLPNNKGNGLVGSEINHNTSSYSEIDKELIQTNQRLMQQQRQKIISTQNAADRLVEFNVGNDLSKASQIVHGKYGDQSYTWKEIGFYSNVGG